MNLITLSNPTSVKAEAYRTLRTNLHFAALEAPLKTLLVVAADDAEAGASALANLAVTMAQSGKRTLVIDANLRQPLLHTLFNAKNDQGFADCLSGAAVSSTPTAHSTDVPNLHVLGSGTPPAIPSDAISSNRMGAVIKALQEGADIVLFNAPPMNQASDAAILASQVDAVVLVIRAGKTRREHAQQAKDTLSRAKARLLGAVMLDV
jgi:non-specific protein-tyrosine kinase